MRRAAGRKSVGSSFFNTLYASSCTPPTARPLGRFFPWKEASHCQRFGGGACHTGYAGNDSGRALSTGESALRRWCDSNTLPYFVGVVYREAFGGMCHLFVADGSGSDGFQRINPTVAHTVGELFFLPPGNALGEYVGKGFRGLLSFLSPCRGTS